MTKIKGILIKAFGLCGTIIGFVVGGMVGKYIGLVLVFPVLGGIIGYLILRKIIKPISGPLLPACIVLSAQLFWLIIGLVLKGTLNLGLLDAAILAGGLTWLMARNSRVAVIFLIIYQTLGFVLNFFGIITADFGTDVHKALLAHLILKFLSVCALIIGLKRIRIGELKGGNIIIEPNQFPVNKVGCDPLRLKSGMKMKYKNFILTVIALLLLALVSKVYFIQDTRNLLKDDSFGKQVYVDAKQNVLYSMVEKDGDWVGIIRLNMEKNEIKSALVFDKKDHTVSSANGEALYAELNRLVERFDKFHK